MNNNFKELIKGLDKHFQDFKKEVGEFWLKIEISNRLYNGDYGVGSIFEEKYSFEINNTLCCSNSIKTFCNNGEFGSDILSKVNISIPFILKEKEIQKLINITNDIKNNNDYLYNEDHYKKDCFDFNRYNYIDIYISGKNYELSTIKDENVIAEIKDLLRINEINEILDNSINNMISMENEKKNKLFSDEKNI